MFSPWISTPKQNPQARMRLFCFPYSGAAASIYYSWATILPGSIEVCPIQYPGHGTRVGDALILDLQDMVKQVLAALVPFLDKPFAFFGHSMGALVAFELARKLGAMGGPEPVYLLMSGHNAPQLPDMVEQMYDLPEPEFIERLRKLNGTPEDVLQNEELRELLLPILRADFRVSENYIYQPGARLNVPLCACGGLQDHYTSKDGMEAWGEQTSSSFTVRMFPGDHFYLNDSKMLLLPVIARELSQHVRI